MLKEKNRNIAIIEVFPFSLYASIYIIYLHNSMLRFKKNKNVQNYACI